MKSLESILKIADIHAKRLRLAMDQLKDRVPVTGEDIENLTDEELPIFDFYINRFSKLQDLMGSSLFGAVLEAKGEPVEQMTFIDKVNKLEKLNVISNAKDWKGMRHLRNSLAHEYPEHPELTARFFNEAFELGQPLLDTLDRIKQFLK